MAAAPPDATPAIPPATNPLVNIEDNNPCPDDAETTPPMTGTALPKTESPNRVATLPAPWAAAVSAACAPLPATFPNMDRTPLPIANVPSAPAAPATTELSADPVCDLLRASSAPFTWKNLSGNPSNAVFKAVK